MSNLTTGWSNLSTKQASRAERFELANRVRLTKIPVRAQLGSACLSMNEYHTLKVGDVLLLDQRTDDPVKVWVNNKVKFWAKPGETEHKRAICVTRVISEQEEIVHE